MSRLVQKLFVISAATLLFPACERPSVDIEERVKEAPAESGDEACQGTCGDLNYQCCSNRADCAPIQGAHVSSSLGCKVPAAFAGCRTAETMCAQAITYAVDPEGDCWELPTACKPDDWTEATPEQQEECKQEVAEATAC